ncbi:uncharacterized protein K441DRAFT_68337 [Cenococcum geophilum 1.58]|uniref:uncharacterized protein n=1 Tax=Cenococcum geophilum 1.58 TaxID=794803 RepID=UPI00358DDF17|nr:hypothetical protein K441DRAFT_68337 [Cenococcum geophilum 1.58]
MTGLKRHAASDFFSDAGEKKARPNDSPRDGSDKYISPQSPSRDPKEAQPRKKSLSANPDGPERYTKNYGRRESMDRSTLHRPSPGGTRNRLSSPQTTKALGSSDMLPPKPRQSLRRGSIEGRSPKSLPSPTPLTAESLSSAVVPSTGNGGSAPQRVAPVAPMMRTTTPLAPSSTGPTTENVVVDLMKEFMLTTTDATSAKVERDRAKMLVDQADLEIQNSAKWFRNFASIKEQKENNKAEAEKIFKDRDEEYQKARVAQDAATVAMALAVVASAGTAAPANDKVHAELRALKEQFQRREAEYKVLQKLTVSHTEQLASLQKEQRCLGAEHSHFKQKFDAIKDDQDKLWRTQSEEIARERRLEGDHDKNHERLRVLEKDLDSLDKDTKALKKSSKEWKPDIKAVESVVNNIQADLRKLKSKELQEQFDMVKKTTKEDIQKARSEIETSIATITTGRANLEQRIDGHDVKLEELEKGVYTGEGKMCIRDQVAHYQKVVEINGDAVEQLKDRLNEENEHIMGRLDLLEKERGAVENLRENLGQVEKRLELMENRARNITTTSVPNSASSGTSGGSGSSGEQLKAQVEALAVEVREVKSEIVGLQSDQTTFEEQILPHWDGDMTNIVSNVEANKTEMLQMLKTLEDRISEHGKQIANLNSRPQSLPVNQAVATQNQQRIQPPPSSYGPTSPSFAVSSQPVQNGITSPPPQVHDFSHQLLAQLNPLRIELSNLQGRINNLDGRSQASYNDLAGRQNNCIQAIQSLENRYDNLTTEELTRNMVNQMQTMYPHASNVQAEIEFMRRQHSTVDARLTDIENNWSSVSGIVARVGYINSKFDSVVGEVANLSQRVKILDDSRERWDEGAGKALEVKVELEKFQDSININAAAKLSAEAATEAANEELVRLVTETTQKLTTEVGNLNEKTLRLVKQVDGQQDAVSILQAAVETVNESLPTPASIPPWDMKVD